jgi:hypothetical protein
MRRNRAGILVILQTVVALGVAIPALAQPPQGRGGRGAEPGGRGLGGARGAPPRDTGAGNVVLPAGTASISGTVVVAGVGLPSRQARVNVSSSDGGGSRTVTTDEQGRFEFKGLAAGRYSLGASKSGHVAISYGATRPGRPGTPIQLEDNQQFTATLQIARGSVITGTVLDEHGEPTPGTQVRVMRYTMQGAGRTMQQSGSGSTDDRGIYRIYGLQPGEYFVVAMARNTGADVDVQRMQVELEAMKQRIAAASAADATVVRELAARASMLQSAIPDKEEQPSGYAPVYFPGTVTVGQAAPVLVGLGEERTSVDFQLQRVPLARVEGTIVNSTGQATQNLQVTLTQTGAMPGAPTVSSRVDGEGRFRLNAVPPGQYRLIARANIGPAGRPGDTNAPQIERPVARGGGPASPPIRLWGATDVSVDGRNIANVIVTLQTGVTITGRVAFEGTGTPPPTDLTRLRVSLAPAEPQGSQGLTQAAAGTVDASGRFTIASVIPGTYRLTASGAGNGWSLSSSQLDGQEALDLPIEVKAAASGGVVTFTDQQAQLSGQIVNQRGQPAAEQTLIIYPADERLWGATSRRIRATRPATDGRFTFTSLPPGEYKLVAMVDVEQGAWFDAAFLQQVDGASTRITIAQGEKKVQNLQVAGGQ